MERGARKKYRTLSTVAKQHSYSGSERKSTILSAGKQLKRKATQARERQAKIQEYSQEDRDEVEQMDLDTGFIPDDTISNVPPPGDEGFDLSHEGGEYEVFEGLAEDIARATGYQYADSRTRTDRVEIQIGQWSMQMDRLINAYLTYRKNDRGDGLPQTSGVSENTNPPFPPFTVETLDISSRSCEEFCPSQEDVFLNETLIQQGFLGSSPLEPALAISIRALEAYRQSHRTCPRFSIEAQCKALCHMYNIPYRPTLRTQFSIAFDAYLQILRHIDRKIDLALGFDTPASRIRRSCPACFYKLQGEPDLEFSYLFCIDGNNSLKRLGSAIRNCDPRLDSRTLDSDRWIPAEEVDVFKDEVKCKQKATEEPEIDGWEDIPNSESGPLNCEARWRNAGPEERKKMFALFEESGIFISCCRHKMVLAACDMIRSGELSKYPLAVVNRLISLAGPKIGCAYDIGCVFETTLAGTSLRDHVKINQFRLMVGAFHGHAHNRICQLRWHPTYINGTGHSEGEGCEHVFSSSNDLARATRHATRFHRHQAIEEHFKFWDEDKYANLSQFLVNHYRAALDAIKTLETELYILQNQLSISPDDFTMYLEQEKSYLQGLEQHSPVVSRKIQYVQALNELSQHRMAWSSARAAANTLFTTVSHSINMVQAMNQTRCRLDTALAKIQHAEEYVGTLEAELNIGERWTESTPEYKEFYQQNVLTEYSRALDELERLVVMRLFELAKMSLSGTGYKLRRQISKALQRRSEAIRKALNRYNAQAARLTPPRPPLSWKDIVDYSFIGEFDLLRHSRVDVRSEPWAQPAQREAALKFFKLCRAKEELVRLNIEIKRLRTWSYDETEHITTTINRLSGTDPLLSLELQRRWSLRASVNNVHLQRLDAVEKLRGFNGTEGIGVREGSDKVREEPTGASVHREGQEVDLAALDDEATNDVEEQLSTITDFMLAIND